MSSHNHPIKRSLALALALCAIAPAAASARLNLNPPPATTPSPQPTVQIVRVSSPAGFVWGDAGIGAAGALGLFMLAIAGRALLVGRRRRPASEFAPGASSAPR